MAEVDRLSARFVATVTKQGYHADGLGLYLVVDRYGKRWAFLFQWRGKRKEMGLGSIHDVSLKGAREERAKARRLVREGKNPIEERKTVSNVTFGALADTYIASQSQWADKTRQSWQNSLGSPDRDTPAHADKLRPRAPADITTQDVLDVLKPIWTTTPEVAGKTRGRIETVLDVAKTKGHREGENPARWRGHLSLMLPPLPKLSRGHHPALPYGEIAAFMLDLAPMQLVSAKCLQATILAAVRTNEATGAMGPEIDAKAMIWTIPKERMKKVKGVPRRDHRVPITKAFLAVVGDLEAIGTGYVFPGLKPGQPISNGAMDSLLGRMGRDDITVHGFRSTFRDWVSEETDFPGELAEMALAHKVGSDVERSYRRGDALEPRRKLMEAWAAYCGR